MVNARQKGATGEESVRLLLQQSTGIDFYRVPGSGNGKIKGDLYCNKCRYLIEVKNYAESPLSDKIFTNKSNNLYLWWSKAKIQAKETGLLPLLFYRYNRSKIYVVTENKPITDKFLYIAWLDCYIMLAQEWLEKEDIKWLHS